MKDLDIYAVRGNHECRTDELDLELELTKDFTTWKMREYYYKKEIDIGNGKKLGLLFIDSCYMLCSSYSYEKDKDFTFGSKEDYKKFKRLQDVQCHKDIYRENGDK